MLTAEPIQPYRDILPRVVGRTELAGLVSASHPLPTVAVTGLSTALSAAAGRGVTGTALVAATVLSGQLSIGWSNDLLDRGRDQAAHRHDKPIADGRLPVATARRACGLAVASCVPLSLANGWAAGAAHLIAVAGGWAYNLGVKRTVASFLPYAVSFALLTAFLTLGLPGSPWPAPWALAAGGLLGVGAHFLNTVVDIDDDLATGVRGLPQRLGAFRAAVTGASLLAGAAVLVVVGPRGPVEWWAWAGLVIAVGSALLAGLLGVRRPAGLSPFPLAVTTAGVTVLLLVARGGQLT